MKLIEKRLTGIEKARIIHTLRQEEIPWNEIGLRFGENPEALRSTLRRYQSDIDDNISILSVLDKSFNEKELLQSHTSSLLLKQIDETERKDGYGEYLTFSDTHGRYRNNAFLKEAILDAQQRGVKKVIVNGDIFDFEAISKFPSNKDVNAKEEKECVKEMFLVLSKVFDVVLADKGNHDDRLEREIARNIKNGYKVFFKDIDAIKIIIDELREEEGIDNIYYTRTNELFLGDVVFAHPFRFSSVPGRTVMNLADSYLIKNRNLSGVIIGHTHYDFRKMYKDIGVFELGCMCHEPDYKKGPSFGKDKWVNAYGFINITPEGKLDYNKSKLVVRNDGEH